MWWSILTSCATVLFGIVAAADRKALQRVVKSAQRITGSSFTTIEDIYSKSCRDRAASIIKDSLHPAHRLFPSLPQVEGCAPSVQEQLGLGTAFFQRLFK